MDRNPTYSPLTGRRMGTENESPDQAAFPSHHADPSGNSSWMSVPNHNSFFSQHDDTRSVSSSIRSARRRRGGDWYLTAKESGEVNQTMQQLEQLQRQNKERLLGSLNGDATPCDDALCRSASLSSACGSVRRRRGQLYQSRSTSMAPEDMGLGMMVTSPTQGSYALQRSSASSRLQDGPSEVLSGPESSGVADRSDQAPSPRRSGLPGWLKQRAPGFGVASPPAHLMELRSPSPPAALFGDAPTASSAANYPSANANMNNSRTVPYEVPPPSARQRVTEETPLPPPRETERLRGPSREMASPPPRREERRVPSPLPGKQLQSYRSPADKPPTRRYPQSSAREVAADCAADVAALREELSNASPRAMPLAEAVPVKRAPPVMTVQRTSGPTNSSRLPRPTITSAAEAPLSLSLSTNSPPLSSPPSPMMKLEPTVNTARPVKAVETPSTRSARGLPSRAPPSAVVETRGRATPKASFQTPLRSAREPRRVNTLLNRGAKDLSSSVAGAVPSTARPSLDSSQLATSSGNRLHTTRLTEIRRQEVLRDRQDRERRVVEESHLRMGLPRRGTPSTSNRVISTAASSITAPAAQSVAAPPSPSIAVERLPLTPSEILSPPAGRSITIATHQTRRRGGEPTTAKTQAAAATAAAAAAAASTFSAAASSTRQSLRRMSISASSTAMSTTLSEVKLPKKTANGSSKLATRKTGGGGTAAKAPKSISPVSSVGHPQSPSHKGGSASPPLSAAVSPMERLSPAPATSSRTEASPGSTTARGNSVGGIGGGEDVEPRKSRAVPFCTECGERHVNDVAKFCAFCGSKRAFI